MGRTSQRVNQPGTGGESARGQTSQGAKEPGANKPGGEKAIIHLLNTFDLGS